jgi:hypothetical protein
MCGIGIVAVLLHVNEPGRPEDFITRETCLGSSAGLVTKDIVCRRRVANVSYFKVILAVSNAVASAQSYLSG